MSGRLHRPAGAARILLLIPFAATGIVGAPQATPEPRVIDVIARRFAFEPSTIEMKVGERVTLAVRSGDGVHGFEIEKLKVKRLIPRGGERVLIEVAADSPGRFPIICSEYCGSGHEDMKGLLVVQAADDRR
jgi:cytochrome c oxidase subunit 2